MIFPENRFPLFRIMLKERQRLHHRLRLQHVGMKLRPANGAFWRNLILARFGSEGKPDRDRKSRVFNYLGNVWAAGGLY